MRAGAEATQDQNANYNGGNVYNGCNVKNNKNERIFMNDILGKLLMVRTRMFLSVGSVGLLLMPLGPSAEAQISWSTKENPYFSFEYPKGWQIKEVTPEYVIAQDPRDPDNRWLGVSFQAGVVNRKSLFQTCQTLDDNLLDIARDIEQRAELQNARNRATAFQRLDVTYEGPHPGFRIPPGGKNIRISYVQNRGGFDEVLAWDQWITAVARTNGIYFLTHKYARSEDKEAQTMWEHFLKTTKFVGVPIKGSGCP
jgi:hypothetical protein